MALMFLKRWFQMNVYADIASIAAAAKPAELVALEAQFDEVQAALRVAHRNIESEQEAASPAHTSPFKVKNDSTMAAAAAKIATWTATAEALGKTSREIRTKIEAARPASTAAIRSALDPLRKQAANDISIAVEALYAAIGRFNVTSAALQQNGVPALKIPETFQILDHFVKKSAAG